MATQILQWTRQKRCRRSLPDCRKKQKALDKTVEEHFTKKWGNTPPLQELCPVNIGITCWIELLDSRNMSESQRMRRPECWKRQFRLRTDEVEKKQPKLSQKAGEKPAKSSWNCRNPQNSSPNQAKKDILRGRIIIQNINGIWKFSRKYIDFVNEIR